MDEPTEIIVDSVPQGVHPLRQIALELARANALLEALVSLMVPQDEPEPDAEPVPMTAADLQRGRDALRRRFHSRRA